MISCVLLCALGTVTFASHHHGAARIPTVDSLFIPEASQQNKVLIGRPVFAVVSNPVRTSSVPVHVLPSLPSASVPLPPAKTHTPFSLNIGRHDLLGSLSNILSAHGSSFQRPQKPLKVNTDSILNSQSISNHGSGLLLIIDDSNRVTHQVPIVLSEASVLSSVSPANEVQIVNATTTTTTTTTSTGTQQLKPVLKTAGPISVTQGFNDRVSPVTTAAPLVLANPVNRKNEPVFAVSPVTQASLSNPVQPIVTDQMIVSGPNVAPPSAGENAASSSVAASNNLNISRQTNTITVLTNP